MLSIPLLSHAALDLGAGLPRSGTLTIGIRHLGLVLAVALIAPLLASPLAAAGDRATLKATAVLLDAPIGLTRRCRSRSTPGRFERAQAGDIPDLNAVRQRGAKDDPELAAVRDS